MTADASPINVMAEGEIPPGERLRQARESAALSRDDIAAKLKLSSRQIAAIETGDLSALPERTFTRGFMRNYARLVGIDPDSLGLDQPQPSAANQLKPTPEAIGEIAREVDRNGRNTARWAVPLLLIAALVAGVLYFQGDRWFGWDTSKFFSASTPSTKNAAAAKAAPSAEKITATAAPTLSSAGVSTGATTDATATSSGAVVAPATSPPMSDAVNAAGNSSGATNTATATVAAAPLLLAANDRRISITFKGKSWTEVRSKGEVIFSETATPGVREFVGSVPLSFTVGNASNVVVMIDGKPFDMTELTRNDVARFRVE